MCSPRWINVYRGNPSGVQYGGMYHSREDAVDGISVDHADDLIYRIKVIMRLDAIGYTFVKRPGIYLLRLGIFPE